VLPIKVTAPGLAVSDSGRFDRCRRSQRASQPGSRSVAPISGWPQRRCLRL